MFALVFDRCFDQWQGGLQGLGDFKRSRMSKCHLGDRRRDGRGDRKSRMAERVSVIPAPPGLSHHFQQLQLQFLRKCCLRLTSLGKIHYGRVYQFLFSNLLHGPLYKAFVVLFCLGLFGFCFKFSGLPLAAGQFFLGWRAGEIHAEGLPLPFLSTRKCRQISLGQMSFRQGGGTGIPGGKGPSLPIVRGGLGRTPVHGLFLSPLTLVAALGKLHAFPKALGWDCH